MKRSIVESMSMEEAFRALNSKPVATNKKLTESVEDDKKKLFDAATSVKCRLDDYTIEYAMHDVDDFIENELVFAGNMLLEERPEMLFWKYGDDSANNFNFGGYFEVYESDDKYPDAYYQIVHDRLYDITDEVNGNSDSDEDALEEARLAANAYSSSLLEGWDYDNKEEFEFVSVYKCDKNLQPNLEGDETFIPAGWTFSTDSFSPTQIFNSKSRAIAAAKKAVQTEYYWDADTKPFIGQFEEDDVDYYIATIYIVYRT